MRGRRLSAEAQAALQAGRLINKRSVDDSKQIPVFELLGVEGLEVMFQPLRSLFGVYMPATNRSVAGVLINANLPRAVQRFTAAHELGHHCLQHDPVTDLESDIDMPASPQEREANAFAERLMLPERLVAAAMRRVNSPDGPRSFEEAYQLSLEVGASYRATLRRLQVLKYVSSQTASAWFRKAPRDAKAAIVPSTLVEDFRRDTIILTPADERRELTVRDGDVVVVEVEEHPTTGYLWDVTLGDLGHRVGDWVIRETGLYGGAVVRRFAMQVDGAGTSELKMVHARPWDRNTVVEERAITVLSESAPRGRL